MKLRDLIENNAVTAIGDTEISSVTDTGAAAGSGPGFFFFAVSSCSGSAPRRAS